MDRDRRFYYGLRNYGVGVVTALVSGLLMYFSRIVFLRYLGVEAVGYTTLFEHVFLLLSSLDLGVSTSLTFYMASAMKDDDSRRMKGALALAGRIYIIISLVIMVFGLLFAFFYLRPFYPGLSLPFLLYLLGQCSQYALGWRVMALNASGRNDLVSIAVQGGRILEYSFSIVAVVLTESFTVFCLVSALCTFLTYVAIYLFSPSVCPWMKNSEVKTDRREDGRLLKTLPAMFSHRVGAIFFRAFEGIAVTVVFGAVEGGKYANLLLFSNFFMTIFWIFQSSVTGIVGDYMAKEDQASSYALYRKITLFTFLGAFLLSLLYGLLGYSLALLSFGEENLPPRSVFSLMTVSVFLLSSRVGVAVVRDGCGEYRKDSLKPVVEIVAVLILLFALSPYFGVSSVPLSIILVALFISLPLDHLVVASRLGKGRKTLLFPLLVLVSSAAGSIIILLLSK